MRTTVLVITNPQDSHADAVIHFLQELKVDVVRWHPGELSADSLCISDDGDALCITASRRRIYLSDVQVCWLRRPEPVIVRAGNPADDKLASEEYKASIWGAYSRMDCVWYSHPFAIQAAGFKLRQLQLALKLGFCVPPFVVSNNCELLRGFLKKHAAIVMKPIHEQVRPVVIEGNERLFEVRRFSNSELDEVTRTPPLGPLFFQKWIDKVLDARVTVIGKKVFASAIHQPADGKVIADWRLHLRKMRHQIISCPDKIQQLLIPYLKNMGLNFGTFDFAVDREGNWWFLECNPNGQWLWIELETGMPIAASMAEALALRAEPIVVPHVGIVDSLTTLSVDTGHSKNKHYE
jgi:glutathione synthase/RimK-type ligase-like ATP-grasp enzyme